MVSYIYNNVHRLIKINKYVRPILAKKRKLQQLFEFAVEIDTRINLNCDSPIVHAILLFLHPHEVHLLRNGGILQRDIFNMYLKIYKTWKHTWLRQLRIGSRVDCQDEPGTRYTPRWLEARVVDITENCVHVHYHGWNSRFNSFIYKADLAHRIIPRYTKRPPWRKHLYIGMPIETKLSRTRRDGRTTTFWHRATVANIYHHHPYVDIKLYRCLHSRCQCHQCPAPIVRSIYDESLCMEGTHISGYRNTHR